MLRSALSGAKTFLITLSGAKPEIVRQCPTDHAKFEGIGGAVLTTTVLAFASMTFALNSALGLPLYAAVPISLLWALAILSLDRWLVGTIQSDGPRRWRLALPRILMAVLIGAVISTPLVLQIFKSEIDAQIVEIKQRRASAFAQQQQADAIGRQVDILTKDVAYWRSVLNSGGETPVDPARDPRIRALTAERDTQERNAARHFKNWNCQRYGGANCPAKGNGPLAREAKAAYDKAKGRAAALNRDIEERRQELTDNSVATKQTRLDQARAQLPRSQAQLDAAQKQQSDLRDLFAAENQKTNGLLIRLQALNEVTGEDLTLQAARLLLFLLFLLIECLPVMVKLMQKPGNYEKVLVLAARQEFREARDTLARRSRPAGADDARTVFEVWDRGNAVPPEAETSYEKTGVYEKTATYEQAGPFERPGPFEQPRPFERPGPYEAAAPPAAERHGREGVVAEEGSGASLDDEVLRGMEDTRSTRAVRSHAPAAPGGERPGRFELFPDDDD